MNNNMIMNVNMTMHEYPGKFRGVCGMFGSPEA